jgi:hypothetical protein
VDHHEAPLDGGRAHRTPLRAGRGRAAVGPGNARVADAARAAADGLRGVRRIEGPRAEGSPRAPGVGVLFDPVVPVTTPPTSELADAADGEDPADRTHAATGADVGVWNPFRQQLRPDPRRATSRPEIGNLHTRPTATGVNVIATLVHRGRRCHGTAVGSSGREGRLRAVAEATVAALQIVADEPLPVGVDRIRCVDDPPARLEIVLVWTTRSGEEALTGAASVHDGPEAAVMQATLDALSRRFEPFVPATPQR